MRIRARSFELRITDCATRLPFRFGITTMTRAPLLVARATITTADGLESSGHSAELLVPKWFEKDPSTSLHEDQLRLLDSVRAAARAFLDGSREPRPLFRLWADAYSRAVGDDPAAGLLRGFGLALLERSLIDAACRAAKTSLFDALQRDLFAFEPERVAPELRGWRPAMDLPERPLESVALRHTVGLVDPLRSSEIPADARVDDGLPVALDENIRAYGLRCFKLKVSGEPDADRERLLSISGVLQEHAGDETHVTLDGNEQFSQLSELADIIDELRQHPDGAWLVDRIGVIEQPLARQRTFDAAANAAMARLATVAPVIIDEADYGLPSLGRALELGYRGISVKNCKGVFKALLHRGLCRRHPEQPIQSAEDLTNLPVIALQQDLATVAALGLGDVERNGHHYFRGLDHLPPHEAEAALAAHPDLYEERDGFIALRIRDGRLQLGSLRCPGYGHDVAVDFEARDTVEAWQESGNR